MGFPASFRARALAFLMLSLASIAFTAPDARAEFLRSERYTRERNLARQRRERNHLAFEARKAEISERHRQWTARLEREQRLSLIRRKREHEARESVREARRIKRIAERQETLVRTRERESRESVPRWAQ